MKTTDEEQAITITKRTLSALISGKAVFTLRSKASGTRFTYRLSVKEDSEGRKKAWFLGLMSHGDNTSYKYMAFSPPDYFNFRTTAASKVSADAPSFRGFQWFIKRLVEGDLETLNDQVELFHAGNCFCCGRQLTTPESVQLGIGPVCLSRLEE